MEAYRRLEDLTLMDDYMFGTVMQDPKLIRPLIERILDMRIRQVTYIEPQRTMKSGFDAKGIRLDLYVEDENGIVYNVEVQTTRHRSLPKRMRYYQSAVDINVLSPGADYARLRKSYIIFICNHDPYGRGRVVYRFENRCIEELELPFGDETVKVVVNTRGTEGTVNAKLLEVIRYLDSGIVSGDFSRDLEEAVNHVKSSEERRHEYMIMMLREQELLEKGREQGREQGIVEGVQKGEARLARLIGHLFSLGRDQDAVRAAGDPEYRRQLYSELGL
jgi:predicted transposase/invertase (TIGR01784 family)